VWWNFRTYLKVSLSILKIVVAFLGFYESRKRGAILGAYRSQLNSRGMMNALFIENIASFLKR